MSSSSLYIKGGKGVSEVKETKQRPAVNGGSYCVIIGKIKD